MQITKNTRKFQLGYSYPRVLVAGAQIGLRGDLLGVQREREAPQVEQADHRAVERTHTAVVLEEVRMPDFERAPVS